MSASSLPCFASSLFGAKMFLVRCFFYTDNNDVRDALIAGHTTNALARKIVVATLGLEREH